MISVKIASIIAVAAFAAGSFFAPPVQQAIAAVIATDVQCTGCVGTADVAGNAITAAKIKDSEVKAAEIATDAVGAAELQGVTKLLFGQCVPPESVRTGLVGPDVAWTFNCNIAGVDADDSATATLNDSNQCFSVKTLEPQSNVIRATLQNDCSANSAVGSAATVAIMVYDK